jgi:hypothetical protein
MSVPLYVRLNASLLHLPLNVRKYDTVTYYNFEEFDFHFINSREQ